MAEAGDALDYDLMTLCGGLSTDDLGGRLSARGLMGFLAHLPISSATSRRLNAECADFADWHGSDKANMLLAALVDELRMLSWGFSQAHSEHSLRRYMPEPIPRPGIPKRDRRVGYDPIPIKDFDSWWESFDEEGAARG